MFDIRKNPILQALLLVIIIWLVLILKAVLVLFFIAFLLTTVLRPLVGWLERHRVPVGLAVILPIIGVLALAALVGYFIVPNIVVQGKQFANSIPAYLHQLQNQPWFDYHLNVASLRHSVQGHVGIVSNTLVAITRIVTTALVGMITIVIVTLYWLGSYERVQQTLLSFVPAHGRARAADVWARTEKKLVSWLVAQFLLGLAVGLMVWIGATIIGMPFAGVLGLIAGMLEIVPTLGPIAAAVPGVLLGFTVSWKMAIAAVILYMAVQQVENHLLAPFLVGRTVRLHPMAIIFSLLIGATLYGILGALLAVPVALVISAIVDSYRDGPPTRQPSSVTKRVKPALPGKNTKPSRRRKS